MARTKALLRRNDEARDKNIFFGGKPVLLNTGATPAHKLRYRAGSAVVELNKIDHISRPLTTEVFGGATLNSQQSFVASVSLADFIPDQDVVPVMAGAPRVFLIWGVVTYEDIFGEEHETKFSILYQWWVDANKVTRFIGRYTRDHNDAN